MSLAYLLFCLIVLLCGVNDLSYHTEHQLDFEFRISEAKYNKKTSNFQASKDWRDLYQDFPFKEGLVYIVKCTSLPDYVLHWEVEPYGLKSKNFSASHFVKRNDGMNEITMVLKLYRNDQITIGCYSMNNKSGLTENKTAFFSWNKKTDGSGAPIPPMNTDSSFQHHRDAEDMMCYQLNDFEKCAIFKPSRSKLTWVLLQINTRINRTLNLQTSSVTDNKLSENEYGWAPVVAGVTGVAVLFGLCFICYKFIRKRKQNEPTPAEPTIIYADLEMESNGQCRREKRDGKNSHYKNKNKNIYLQTYKTLFK